MIQYAHGYILLIFLSRSEKQSNPIKIQARLYAIIFSFYIHFARRTQTLNSWPISSGIVWRNILVKVKLRALLVLYLQIILTWFILTFKFYSLAIKNNIEILNEVFLFVQIITQIINRIINFFFWQSNFTVGKISITESLI